MLMMCLIVPEWNVMTVIYVVFFIMVMAMMAYCIRLERRNMFRQISLKTQVRKLTKKMNQSYPSIPNLQTNITHPSFPIAHRSSTPPPAPPAYSQI